MTVRDRHSAIIRRPVVVTLNLLLEGLTAVTLCISSNQACHLTPVTHLMHSGYNPEDAFQLSPEPSPIGEQQLGQARHPTDNPLPQDGEAPGPGRCSGSALIADAARGAGLSGEFSGHCLRFRLARHMALKDVPTSEVMKRCRCRRPEMVGSYTRVEAA